MELEPDDRESVSGWNYADHIIRESYRNISVYTSSEILNAVIKEDLRALIDLVNSGKNLNVLDRFGNGPLHLAILSNNCVIFDYLLTRMKNLNIVNFAGETALLKSISCCKYDITKKLILAGADVNIPNSSYTSPLHFLITIPDLALLLIKHGANVDATNVINQTPLHYAVKSNCLEGVCMLLWYNADANVYDLCDQTPFMRAMDANNMEIQEVLVGYVDNFNVTREDNWSILGVALERNSPFIEDMIKGGANVDKVNRDINGALLLALQCPLVARRVQVRERRRKIDLNVLKLVWDNMNYKFTQWRSVLGNLYHIGSDEMEGVLDVLMESDKFYIVAQSVSYSDDLHIFTYKFAETKLPLGKFTEVFCMLLSYGYTPNSFDMSVIFNHYGNCELYRMLLYMDIRIKDDSWLSMPDKLPTRLMYDAKSDPFLLMDDLVHIVMKGIYSYDDSLALVIVRLLDYTVYPKLVRVYLKLNKTDCVSLKMNALPKVPSLLELARNAARRHIVQQTGVTTSCQLHTVINHLNMSVAYKDILTFRRVLYRPTYTVVGFKHFIKAVERCKVIRNIIQPIIQSARANAKIIYL